MWLRITLADELSEEQRAVYAMERHGVKYADARIDDPKRADLSPEVILNHTSLLVRDLPKDKAVDWFRNRADCVHCKTRKTVYVCSICTRGDGDTEEPLPLCLGKCFVRYHENMWGFQPIYWHDGDDMEIEEVDEDMRSDSTMDAVTSKTSNAVDAAMLAKTNARAGRLAARNKRKAMEEYDFDAHVTDEIDRHGSIAHSDGRDREDGEPSADEKLSQLGLRTVQICGDGNCLFYAIGHALGLTERTTAYGYIQDFYISDVLRTKALSIIDGDDGKRWFAEAAYPNTEWDDVLYTVRADKRYAGEFALRALAVAHQRDIYVINTPRGLEWNVNKPDANEEAELLRSTRAHTRTHMYPADPHAVTTRFEHTTVRMPYKQLTWAEVCQLNLTEVVKDVRYGPLVITHNGKWDIGAHFESTKLATNSRGAQSASAPTPAFTTEAAAVAVR
ncbi:hypothetical protein CYMTET_37556 [Cymbomonas tetramitiformis]|uniref:OTU domain-containing protein n=2 Tax=Cymbomonas tetramitiformis TaxID=36881 RepID=A0AAE0F6B8_9CHLO|nr:hypothetical protein CYMTET_37556 [Cymbomonas tetramitiformis]